MDIDTKKIRSLQKEAYLRTAEKSTSKKEDNEGACRQPKGRLSFVGDRPSCLPDRKGKWRTKMHIKVAFATE